MIQRKGIQQDAQPQSERYERSDARPGPLVLVALTLALLLGASLALSAWLSQRLTDGIESLESASPLLDLRKPPQGPGLQAAPVEELARQRAWEERILSATEWVDPVNGIVRIPIDQALELSLREGFPSRAPREGGR